MSAHLKFKKSALCISVSSFIQWKHTKYLCISVFLSFVTHQSFAAATSDIMQSDQKKSNDQIQTKVKDEPKPIDVNKTVKPISNLEKIGLTDQDQDTVPDSMNMLQEQLKQNNDLQDFKNIELDDLGPLPSFEVDQSMANEIDAIADEAKKEALQYRANQKNDVIVSEATKQELAEINVAPINIDNLMSNIKTDSKIVVEANETGSTLKELGLEADQTTDVKKPNFFRRLVNLVRPPKNEDPQTERITADVKIFNENDDRELTKQEIKAQQALKDNIKAKLSSYTAEAFDDYSSAVPQLRSLSTQAAQAVGFYNAKFQFEKKGRLDLNVFVDPGEPVIVQKQEIEFMGAGADLPQFQVIALLPELQAGDVLNQGLYTKTKTRINEAASNNGYFDSFWRLHDVQVFQPQDTAEINLKFETGNRYKLGVVEFKMSNPTKEIPLDADILEKMVPWEAGQDYAYWRVNTLANNLTNSRYFNFTLVDTIIPDPIEKPLELPPDLQALLKEEGGSEELAAQLNPPVEQQSAKEVTQTLVNESEFAGTVQSNDKSKSGIQSLSELEETKLKTTRLKEQAREKQEIPVIVTLNADQLNNVGLGLGYGSDTGVRLRSQYRRAIVNRRGHSFDANLELSKIRQSIEGRYNIPFNHPLNDYFALVAGYEREDRQDVTHNGNLLVESGVAGIDRVIRNPRGDWQHIMSLRYRLDRLSGVGIFDIKDIPDWFLASRSGSQQESLLFGYEISRIDANKRINPTQGISQSYRVDVGSDKLLNDTNLAILNANWKFLYSYGENANNQFVGRASLGYIFTNDFYKVPYNLRYFAGGDQSIRGFDYKSLSPTESGFKVGGQALAVGSIEYNYQFKEGWRAAVFSDFGNAYDENFSNPIAYSVGLGLRWASPIGPIRIDVASGISSEDHPIRLHFIIGPQL